MFVSFKIAIKEIQGMLRVLSFSLLGFYISSCQKINSEKEEVLVRVVYDLITYDATDVPDIEILDSDNNKCWLSDQIDRDKIIFYLPNLGCSSCYEQEILSIGQALCGASQVFPQREIGVGGTNGTGERSEGGIDRH